VPGLFVQLNEFTNAGSLDLTDAAMAIYAPSGFSNSGTLTLDGNSSLQIYAELTTAQLGTINLASGAFIGFDQTLDNRGATFDIPTGVSVLGSIEGGTIEGAFLLDAPYPSTFSNTLSLSGSPTLEGAGGTGNGTINVTGDYADLFLSGTETINGATIDIGNDIYQDLITVEGGGTVTLASSTSIVAAVAGGYYSTPTLSGTGAVINDGTIQAEQSGGAFLIDPTSFTNAGTITVANGTNFSVDLTGNTGTISIDGTSTINFTSALTTAELGTIDTSSGTVLDFAGTLNNAGATYNVASGTILEGTINGGTIDGTINLNGPNANNALTLTGSPTLNGAGGTGTATINDTATAAILVLTGTETINNAVINIGNTTYSGGQIANTGGDTVTFGSALTIDQSVTDSVAFLGTRYNGYTASGSIVNHGTINAAANGGQFTVNQPAFTNAGTIAVTNGDTFNLDPTSFSNTGTITVDGTSTLDFQFSILSSQFGTIKYSTGATLDFSAGLDNAGETYVIPTGVNIEGIIDGGKIDGPLNLTAANQSLTLEGVMVAGSNGSGPGTIDISGDSATLTIAPATTLSNVAVDLGSTDRSSLDALNADNATIGANVTIDVSASGASTAIQGSTVNDGTINVSSNGGYLQLGVSDFSPVSFTNNGTISVTNGAALDFGNFNATLINNGTISVDGTSALYIGAPITTSQFDRVSLASGATLGIDLDNTGATFVVPTGVVISGTIAGGTIEGSLSLTPNTDTGIPSLTLSDSPLFEGRGGAGPGTIDDTANNSELNLLGPETLGNVTINIGNSQDSFIVNNTQDLVTFASNATIDQSAAGTTASVQVLPYEDNGQGEIINDGSIVAAASGGAFNIQGLTFVNAGTISVSNGDTLNIGQNMGPGYFSWFANTGTISIDGTSTVKFLGEMTLAMVGTLDTASGATIDFSGTLDNSGTTFTVPIGATIEGTIEGGTIAGTLSLSAASQSLTLIGPLAFTGENGTGAGTIDITGAGSQLLSQVGTFANVTINIGNANSQGASFVTEGPEDIFASSVTVNQSVAGTGAYIESSQGTILNYGSILAQSSGGAFFIDPAVMDNYGTISDANGDFVILDPGRFGNSGTITQTGAGSAMFLGPDSNVPSITNFGYIGNTGSIISGASGAAIGIDPEEFDNSGSIVATKGGEVLIGPETFDNLPGTTLTGGTYEVDVSSTFEFVNFTTIVTDDATIILSGANSVMKQLNPTTNVTVTLESTLTSTGTSGILSVQAGRDWTQTTAFTNAGIIELGGGTFQVSSLTNSGTILGFGTVSGAVTDSGALIAFAGTLGFQGGSFSGISGTLASGMMVGAGANATLQLPGNISIATLDGEIALSGSGAAIQSLNGSAEVSVQSTLKTIAASGVLEVGDTYTSSNAISNAGTIQMGGGILSTGLLTDSAGSNLYGDGTVASVFSDSGSVTSTGGALVFTGSGDTFANALGGQQVTFGGGTDLLQSGSNLTAGEVSISGSAAVAFATSQSYAGTWNQGAGTVNLGANTLTLSGTGSSIGGTVSGSGTLAFTGGSQAIGSGASLTVSNWTLSGSDAVSVSTSLTYGGTFSAAAGTTLTMSSGDTLTLTGTTTFAGSTAGPGTLSFSGGTETFDADASFGSALAIHSAAKVSLGGSVSVAGALSQAAGTSIAIAAGSTLTLSGTGSAFAGAVTGTGTLAFSGGTDKLSAGTSLAVSDLSLSSGATASLAWSLAYAGDLSEAAGTTFALNSYALTLSGAGSTIAGAITGTAGGGLTFSGGSQAFDSGATLTTAKWTLSGTDAVALDENLAYGGTFAAGAGTTVTIASGDTLTLNGVATIADKISGTGSLAFTGGSQTLNGGTTLAGSGWTISGSDAVKLDASVSYGGPFSAGAGTTLTIASGDTLTLTGASTFAGSTAGAGTLELSFGAETFEAGAHFGSLVSLHSAAQATVNGAVSISGALSETAGTAIAIGGTLTLSGTGSAFAGAVTGTGTLAFSGGTDKLSAGTNLAVSDLSLSSGATASLAWSLAYAGDLNEAAGTTFALGPYTLTLSGAGSTISGAITGAGDLTLSGGSQAFDSGATLTTAKWTLSGTDTVALNENLTYAGTYSQAATTSFTIAASDTLALTGAASLAGTVTGAGIVSVSNATVSGLVVGGTLDDLGTVHQTGLVTIGDSSGDAATLSIASGDSYDIGANVNIAIGTSAASVIDDNGLLIKNAGTGISDIALSVVDNGQVEVATGTLELSKAVTGSGTMTVEAGATLELGSSAAATLGLTFGGAGATLALTNPAGFAATIAGFAATDKIDLVNIAATAATLETGDKLVITDGTTTVATLQLTGTYTGYAFNTVADGHGGTDITATAPGAPREPGGDQASAGDTFDFHGQFGNVTIADYSGGHDMLVFDRADFADAASVEAHATQNALGDTIVTLDPHDTITLVGVSLNRFEANAADWHFV
jgi:fibronectin-binding autotransporter adhesin